MKRPTVHKHAHSAGGSWRGFLSWGEQLNWGLRIEVSRRWRSSFIATVGYGGQEDFAEWTMAIPRLFFLHVAFDTPFRFKRWRPFDGKYSESEAGIGFRSVGDTLYFLVGHDSSAGWYSTHGRGGAPGRWVRDIKRNRQVTLFRGDWVLGTPRHTLEVLQEEIPLVVNVGQWEGDAYRGTAKHTRRTWKRRFSTTVSDGFEIEMQEGIPFPGKGENSWDCGDDAFFGFGGATIESAAADIVAHTLRYRKERGGANWRPEGVLE